MLVLTASIRRSKLRLGFAVAFLAAIVVAAAGYNELRRYYYWNSWVSHTQTVLDNIDTQKGELIEALSRLDRYRRSSDVRELSQLDLISAKLQRLSATLRMLTRDNPVQQAQLTKIESILHLLPSLLGQGINVAQRNGSVQPSWSPDLTSVLYQLLASFRQMTVEENRLLTERLSASRIASQRSVSTIVLGASLIFAWLLFLTSYAERSAQQIHEMARTLTHSQQQLLLAAERRKADEVFRKLIESAQDAMVIVDHHGRIGLANRQAEMLYGYTRSELLGMKAEMLAPVRYRDQYRTEPRLRTAGSGMEFYGLRKDGIEFPVEVSVGPVELEDETVISMAVRDVTAKKKIQEELRESDERYRILVQNLQGYAIYMLDPDGHVMSWNDGAQRINGYTAEEVIGQHFSCFYPPEDIANGRPIQELLEARTTGRCEIEGWRIRKDGSRFWADGVITAFYGSAGEFRGYSKIVRDITERKLAEEKFRGLLESAPDAMVIVGKDGRIQLVNAQTEALFGYRREELLGQSVEILVPERFRSRHPQYRDGFFTAPKVRGMGAGADLAAVRKDGTEFAAEISLSPISTPQGTLVTAAVRDITERKRLEAEQRRRVEEANRLKSEFLANMSHEIRTPLNAIIGFASLIQGNKVGPLKDDQREYMQDILTSARHLLHLINDILDLAKIEAGKIDFHSEPFAVTAAISEVIDTLRALATDKHIHVNTDFSPMVENVTVDPAKFKQVLYNYLSNAIKFTPEEGTVTVRTTPEGDDWFRLEVEDTGIGVAPSDMHRLFVEFQQLDASAGKKYAGTGLGLSLTKRIVEAQGGSISVHSVLGKGSIFAAILPRLMRDSQEFVSPPLLPRPVPGQPILVIEDDRADREWLVKTLSDVGYSVKAAATGAEAVKLCNEHAFAAITLDLLLPDTSGWEVLREIRSTPFNRQVPAIVITVSPDQGLRRAFVLQDYLVKPVEEQVLVGSLKEAGIHPCNGAVLVIDHDLAALKLVRKHLNQLGYRVVYKATAEAALEFVQKEPPAIIVLELLLPGMNGFQFLDELSRLAPGRHIPVIVWTVKDLSSDERRRIREYAQAVVSRTDPSDLVEQLKPFLASPSNNVPKGGVA